MNLYSDIENVNLQCARLTSTDCKNCPNSTGGCIYFPVVISRAHGAGIVLIQPSSTRLRQSSRNLLRSLDQSACVRSVQSLRRLEQLIAVRP